MKLQRERTPCDGLRKTSPIGEEGGTAIVVEKREHLHHETSTLTIASKNL